jgi:hypothetical protein
MDEIGVPLYTSYVFLGLSLSIGLLVYILIRDAKRRKQEREEAEQRRVETLLREVAERERMKETKDVPQEKPGSVGDEVEADGESQR